MAGKFEDRVLSILQAQEAAARAAEGVVLKIEEGSVLILPDGQRVSLNGVLKIIVDCDGCKNRTTVARLACHQGCPKVRIDIINFSKA